MHPQTDASVTSAAIKRRPISFAYCSPKSWRYAVGLEPRMERGTLAKCCRSLLCGGGRKASGYSHVLSVNGKTRRDLPSLKRLRSDEIMFSERYWTSLLCS